MFHVFFLRQVISDMDGCQPEVRFPLLTTVSPGLIIHSCCAVTCAYSLRQLKTASNNQMNHFFFLHVSVFFLSESVSVWLSFSLPLSFPFPPFLPVSPFFVFFFSFLNLSPIRPCAKIAARLIVNKKIFTFKLKGHGNTGRPIFLARRKWLREEKEFRFPLSNTDLKVDLGDMRSLHIKINQQRKNSKLTFLGEV